MLRDKSRLFKYLLRYLYLFSTRNIEYTTLNQTPVTFTVNSNSEVLFEYLIESI